ncbi:precorrin-2 dehydrogenase/sirohydrochlorin ferrochelatase family protein [Thermospira aquatica]|uniref:precorrin-2 dehydrogenase n=1 Tax=Thermospira aquatica TaxID=2828656 RepID=A0AAX3BAD6_9SPIR|nr:bifunctional precorrin-2 dehydrogenase/sirohydrochlorin ferrochelatase [Thermospira aquatica]URA09224.1 bifunctional precorrin-2 dehydrogenase/sirohydrochlorin ferrochelatase [Thermospira aquatica]
MTFLPIAINIEGKKILIIGGGKVAFQKANILSLYTRNITFLALEFIPEIQTHFSDCVFLKRAYKKCYLKKFFLVYACTNDNTLNQQIAADAKKLSILVNVCDSPEFCDFISPAIYKKKNVSIAVTTNGTSAKQSVFLRNTIKEFLENAGF